MQLQQLKFQRFLRLEKKEGEKKEIKDLQIKRRNYFPCAAQSVA